MSNDKALEDEYILDVMERFDVYDIVDMLNLTMDDLVDKFRDEILSNTEIQETLRM